MPGEDYHRDSCVHGPLEFLKEGQAVHLGHHEVEHDGTWPNVPLAYEVERLHSVRHSDDPMALYLQEKRQRVAGVFRVLDDDDRMRVFLSQ